MVVFYAIERDELFTVDEDTLGSAHLVQKWKYGEFVNLTWGFSNPLVEVLKMKAMYLGEL